MDSKWAQNISEHALALYAFHHFIALLYINHYKLRQHTTWMRAEAAGRGIVLRARHIELEADFHLRILHVGSIQSPLDIVSCLGLIWRINVKK